MFRVKWNEMKLNIVPQQVSKYINKHSEVQLNNLLYETLWKYDISEYISCVMYKFLDQ